MARWESRQTTVSDIQKTEIFPGQKKTGYDLCKGEVVKCKNHQKIAVDIHE
jgi:hypothetical protein